MSHCWHPRSWRSGGDGGGAAVVGERCCHCGAKRQRNQVLGPLDPDHGPHVATYRQVTTQIRGGRGPCVPCEVAASVSEMAARR